jgi:hypothetical protein
VPSKRNHNRLQRPGGLNAGAAAIAKRRNQAALGYGNGKALKMNYELIAELAAQASACKKNAAEWQNAADTRTWGAGTDRDVAEAENVRDFWLHQMNIRAEKIQAEMAKG